MSGHEVRVTFMLAYREYVARCSCGWTGSYFESKPLAVREADMHKANPDGAPYGRT